MRWSSCSTYFEIIRIIHNANIYALRKNKGLGVIPILRIAKSYVLLHIVRNSGIYVLQNNPDFVVFFILRIVWININIAE